MVHRIFRIPGRFDRTLRDLVHGRSITGKCGGLFLRFLVENRSSGCEKPAPSPLRAQPAQEARRCFATTIGVETHVGRSSCPSRLSFPWRNTPKTNAVNCSLLRISL